MTGKYCLDRGISFPSTEVPPEDLKDPRECYLFAKAEDLRSPVVLHFPLVNRTFRTHLAPGERKVWVWPTEPWGGDGVLDPGQCTSWRPPAGHCFLDSACTLARLLPVGERAEMRPQAEPTDQPDALGKGRFWTGSSQPQSALARPLSPSRCRCGTTNG